MLTKRNLGGKKILEVKMTQGKEPYKGKTLFQVVTGSTVVVIAFVAMIALLPTVSYEWFIVSLIAGFFLVVASITYKLSVAKDNVWIKFTPGLMFDVYLLMLSMRAFSYLLGNEVVGIIFPLVSFVLTGFITSFSLIENLPSVVQGNIQTLSKRLNKIALAFISIAGVLGASFGMFMARTGRMGMVAFVMGIMSYIISLMIANQMFKQFIKERRQNGES